MESKNLRRRSNLATEIPPNDGGKNAAQSGKGAHAILP
jgi:hypothetical protein